MKNFIAVISVFVLSLFPTTRLAAQTPLEGSRVRIVLNRPPELSRWELPSELIGTVVSDRSDTIALRIHPSLSVVAVPIADIRSLQVSLGVPSRSKSALLGAARIAPLGALYGVLVEDIPEKFEERLALGLAFGAISGAIVGALMPLERWRRVRR